MDCQGAEEEPGGRPEGPGALETARALLPLRDPPGLPSGLLIRPTALASAPRAPMLGGCGGGRAEPPPPSKSYYGDPKGPGAPGAASSKTLSRALLRAL